MTNLTGKVALVTGGNSGIGFAAAQELAQAGARVIITGRRKEAVEEAATLLGVDGLLADQSKLTDIETLAALVAQKYGRIDILVINAGISKLTTIENATEEVYDEVMNVNLKGAYFTISRFIPVLNDGSSIIVISSSSASKATPQTSIYASGKMAINTVIKIAAVELAPRKIRINAVSPGPFSTAIMEKTGLSAPGMQDYIVARVPLGRLGIPAEAGKLICFLAGEDAVFITGAEYMIDGGQSLNQ